MSAVSVQDLEAAIAGFIKYYESGDGHLKLME